MKKIVHICQSNHGGAAEYLNLIITHLDKNQYIHTLICPSDGDLIHKAHKQNIKIYPLEMQREISAFKDFKHILSIRKILRKEKADILFLHSSKAGALGRLAALFQNTKIVYNPHGWAFNMQCSKLKKSLYLFIEKLLYPLTDMIINISQDEYSSALINKLHPRKLYIVENGIEIQRFTPPPA